jgi:replication initiation and membrane attachment protein DnaB
MNKKHEDLRNEILNDDNIPQDLKDKLNNLKTEFEIKWSEEDKLITNNIKNGKKIISYDKETFLPIFE